MADKNLPYSLLKAVMTAATEAHVAKLSLGVVEKESQIKPPGGG